MGGRGALVFIVGLVWRKKGVQQSNLRGLGASSDLLVPFLPSRVGIPKGRLEGAFFPYSHGDHFDRGIRSLTLLLLNL